MSIQMALLGSSGSSIITARDLQVTAFSDTAASAAISFRADGAQSRIVNGSQTVVGNWVAPAYTANEWEIRVTLVSGDTPTGTLGSWLPLTSTRTWTLSTNVVDIKESSLTVDFRKVGDTDPVTTITGFSLTAIVEGEFRV